MFCPKCGKEVNPDSAFCMSCGNKLDTNVTPAAQPVQPTPVVESVQQPVVQPQPIAPQAPAQPKAGLAGWQKGLIIGLLSVVFILLTILAIVGFNSEGGSIFSGKSNYKSRTIMVYLVGSNLEYQVMSATADMAAVDPSSIDFNTTNILIYTGGTKYWHNEVRNDENAIYKLTPNGWLKVESYPKVLMNDGTEFTKFLKYGYDNYKADQYNLIVYDHGGAYQGAVVDDFDSSGNSMSIDTFDKAFKNSPFNGTTAKLNTIQFRACLMGNMEAANVFSKYANYYVASEEVVMLGKYIGIFGEAFNGIKPSEDEVATGKRFISGYKNKMESQNIDYPVTYSIIDLTKLGKLVEEYNNFMDGIDVDSNYYDITKIRAGLYQFPDYSDANAYYDLVDVKQLVNSLSGKSKVSVDAFNKAFDEAVVYNEATVKGANGLTVYFPYKAQTRVKEYNNKIYETLPGFEKYKSFLKKYESARSQTSTNKTFAVGATEINKESSKTITYQLSDDLYNKYEKAMYFIFRRDEDHPNYFQIISNSYDVELGEDKKLKLNLPDKYVYIEDDKGNGTYIPSFTYNNAGHVTTESGGIFYFKKDPDKEFDLNSTNANFEFVEKNGKPTVTNIRLESRDDRVNGGVFDNDQFSSVAFVATRIKLLNASGKLLDNEDWETSPEIKGFSADMDELDEVLKYKPMDDGEWYILLYIKDFDSNQYKSDLIKVGE